MSKKDPNEIVADHIETVLGLVYKTLEATAKDFKSKSVPLTLIKQAHIITMTGYRKGFKENKK